MAEPSKISAFPARAIETSGGGSHDDGMEGRVAALETAVKELKAGVDAFRHNQTVMFTAVVFVLTVGLAAIFFVGTSALGEIRAMNGRIDRILERQTSPASPSPAPTKSP